MAAKCLEEFAQPQVTQRRESSVCLRNATAMASSSLLRTVEDGSFGPIAASAIEVLRFHLATVFGLIP
jgi:hypothetical protein